MDGVEEIEISLTPKSLGRLNVTINMQDTIAKISITAESANAAALLADAESKLSQMMEAFWTEVSITPNASASIWR